jgi:hypothetical protein
MSVGKPVHEFLATWNEDTIRALKHANAFIAAFTLDNLF